ncbi:MAG: helix-turn-helix transcriptional regulator [Deltaproteobacteria bacterium]|nr:helix-turn-helix transcriptional regulator [Deltaproteobacteria bacterium]
MPHDMDTEKPREKSASGEGEAQAESADAAFRKELGAKFREARENLKMSQAEAAKAVGVALRTWQAYEGGTRLPGAEVFAALAKHNVNVTWFFADDAPFFRDYLADLAQRANEVSTLARRKLAVTSAAAKEASGMHSVAKLELADRFFVPPIREWRDREGNKIDRLAQQHSIAFSPDYIQKAMGDPIEDIQFFLVDGDAMAPTILAGDFVTFHPGMWSREVDGLHVIKQDGAGRVRRLQFLPGDRVLVASDNTSYQSFEYDLSLEQKSLEILGRVAWVARKL